MAFDGPPKAMSAAELIQEPAYKALEKHLQDTRGYGFQTFYGKLLVMDTKIANYQRTLNLIGITEQEKANAIANLQYAQEGRERLFNEKGDGETTKKLWEAYIVTRPDLGLGK